MKEYKEFMLKLFTRLAIGNDKVGVEISNGKIEIAHVIGYDDEYMTVKVCFESDVLTKEETDICSRCRFRL